MIVIDNPLTELVAAANAVLRPDSHRTVIRSVTTAEMQRDAVSLFEENWQENVRPLGIDRLELNAPFYESLERSGMLIILAAYLNETMVGYSVNMLMPHPHFTQITVCRNDVFFVGAAWRARAPMLLLRATEAAAALRGATRVAWTAKIGSPFMAWLPRVGYHAEETTFIKEI